MHTTMWLIRREFWENRAIWVVPAVIGVALTIAALFGRIDFGAAVSAEQQRMIAPTVLLAYGFTFFAVMSIYSSWYLMECLYADRKDRSVLFWKSLPISDTATVLAKLFTAVIAIPLVYFLAADVSTLLLAFIVSMRAHAYFGSVLWQPELWLQLHVLWLYVIVTTAIWFLPFTGWLMLVSAWAKRAVALWLVLPPLALYGIEQWFFGSHFVGSQLTERALGYLSRAFYDHSNPGAWATTAIGTDTITAPTSVWHLLNPVGFVSSPATWIGVLVGAAMIYGAIQLRLRRTET
jgi:ABC-2 type transport system permease protein